MNTPLSPQDKPISVTFQKFPAAKQASIAATPPREPQRDPGVRRPLSERPTPIAQQPQPVASPQVVRAATASRTGVQEAPRTAQRVGEEDPNLDPIELPSEFAPYTFKQIYARPIRAKHQAKFAVAAERKNLRMVVETIGSLIEGCSAYDLTAADFKWLMYYLRRVNYVKVPLTVTMFCSNPKHIEQVAKEEVDGRSLENLTTLDRSVLEERALDMNAVNAVVDASPFLQTLRLGFPMMSDTVEAAESDDPEFEWLAELAMGLAQTKDDGTPWTLQERVEHIGSFAPEEVEELAKYVEAASDYGVSEKLRMKCKGCGAEMLEDFQPSASMFL